MSNLTIYSYPNNPKVWKAIIAGKYNGIEINYPPFNFGVDNKTPEFLKKNPLGKVPVLETPEGCIFESNAIARYVASLGKNKLLGNTPYESALIDQWIHYCTNEIEYPGGIWLGPIFGYLNEVPVATAAAKEDIHKALTTLNTHLLHHTFLVGERISLADIIVSLHLAPLYKMVLDPEFRAPYSNTNRWFLTCINQPEFKEVMGEFVLCEKMTVAVPKETTPAHPKADKKEKQPKEPKQPKAKPEAKPKEEKKKETKKETKKEEEGDEEELGEEEEAKPKAKNPLDFLPPSKLNLDEWKRTYSNNDTRTVAVPWFWEHYDNEGYSLYFCHYKFNNELTKLFMTCNLVSGFLQRLDKLRKYGFGTMMIHGKEPALEISGFWVFRGKEIPPEMCKECDDYDLYTWTPVDINNAGHRTLVEDYLAWDGDFGGKGKPTEGKSFK